MFGTVCSEFTARLDELGQRSPQISARGLFHCSGVWTLTVKVVLPLPQLLQTHLSLDQSVRSDISTFIPISVLRNALSNKWPSFL